MEQRVFLDSNRRLSAELDAAVLFFSRHWLAFVNVMLGLWVTLPWLAPVLMHAGAVLPARALYLFYSFQCHQLPQRSYFLFGKQLMVPLHDILNVYPAGNPLRLHSFLGSPEMGWKVAWSDRMVALYTPLFLGGLLFGLTGRRWKPLAIWTGVLLIVPLALDGISHTVSDALGLGFRDTNTWLAVLTGHAFAPAFYAGDFLGSFNWWARLLSGLLAGFAAVWLAYPHIEASFARMERAPGSRQASP